MKESCTVASENEGILILVILLSSTSYVLRFNILFAQTLIRLLPQIILLKDKISRNLLGKMLPAFLLQHAASKIVPNKPGLAIVESLHLKCGLHLLASSQRTEHSRSDKMSMPILS